MGVTLVLCDIGCDRENIDAHRNLELGSYEYINSCFSVVSELLEGGNWGSKYPILLEGWEAHSQFDPETLQDFSDELDELKEELKKYSPKDAGDNISDEDPIDKSADTLYDFFLTEEDEENLFETLQSFVQEAIEEVLAIQYIFS